MQRTGISWRGVFNFVAKAYKLVADAIAMLDIILQKTINFNRLAFNENEILFLGNWKALIQLEKIQSINLNGWNNNITVKSNKMASRISFKSSQISQNELAQIFALVDKKKGLQNIKISDNLRRYSWMSTR